MKGLILIGLYTVLMLGGCASDKALEKPEIVNVPIPVRCTFTKIDSPDMVFDTQAKESMDLFTKTQLLIVQDMNLKAYLIKLEAAANGCSSGSVVFNGLGETK